MSGLASHYKTFLSQNKKGYVLWGPYKALSNVLICTAAAIYQKLQAVPRCSTAGNKAANSKKWVRPAAKIARQRQQQNCLAFPPKGRCCQGPAWCCCRELDEMNVAGLAWGGGIVCSGAIGRTINLTLMADTPTNRAQRHNIKPNTVLLGSGNMSPVPPRANPPTPPQPIGRYWHQDQLIGSPEPWNPFLSLAIITTSST